MNRVKLTSLLILVIAQTSCTFQSSQLDSLQNIFTGESDPLAGAEWVADWGENDYLLYAVNAPGEVIFAYDKRIRIHFDGWNITEVVGVFPNDSSVRIEEQDGELIYFLNDRLISRHRCDLWEEEKLELGASQHHQNCLGREPYVNKIDVSSTGIITRLTFLIHPEYPPIVMTPLNEIAE